MINLISLIVSNVLVAGMIALIAIWLKSKTRFQSLSHALFVVALIKLVTPAIVSVPLVDLSKWHSASLISEPHVELAKNRSVPVATGDEPIVIDSFSPEFRPADPARISISDSETFRGKSIPAKRPLNLQVENAGLPGSVPFIPILITCWLVGSFSWLWRVCRSGQKVRRLIAVADSQNGNQQIQRSIDRIADRMGLSNKPQLAMVNGSTVPMIWASWSSTTLVLPRPLLNRLTQTQIDTLIAHELAHVWCSHHWVRRLEVVVMAFYWWCPLVWVIRKQMHETEEQVCDAWVTHILPDSSADYANALVDTLHFVNSESAALPVGASGISQFQLLKRRITMIMKLNHNPGLSISSWLIIATMLIVGIPFSAQPTQGLEAANLAPAVDAENEDVPTWQDRDDDDEVATEWRDRENDNEWQDRDDEAELVEELVEELTEELEEMDSEIAEEIADVREDLADGFNDAPAELRQALSRINIRDIVQRSLTGAPKSAQMFVREVDPAGLVERLIDEQDWNSDDLDPDQIDEMEAKIKKKLGKGIKDLVNRVQKQIDGAQQEVYREVADLPASIKKELVNKNIVSVIEEILEESSPIMQQFVADADLTQHLSAALTTKRKNKARRSKSVERKVKQRQAPRRGSRNQWREETVEERRGKLERKIDVLAEELDRLRAELRSLDRSDRGR